MSQLPPTIDERPLLDVMYTNRRVLPSMVRRGNQWAELFVPVSLPPEEVGRVRVKVSFGDTGKNFYIAGRAEPSRAGIDTDDGFVLVIEWPEDRRSFQHLWSFCTGWNPEQARRFATSIACSIRAGAKSFAGKILDLSMSGAFVAGEATSAFWPGAAVQVRVPTGFLRLGHKDIPAHLVWQGWKSGTAGLGVEFVDGGRAGLDLLRQRVKRA